MKVSHLVLAIAAMAVTPAFAQQAPAPAPETPPAATTSQMSAQDFANKAGMANMFEVETSKVALEKSTRDDVKQFAQQMIDDHGKAGEELKAAADSQGGVTVPTDMDEDQKGKLDQLNSAEAADFDQMYIEMQTAAHKEAVSLFDDFSKNGEDGAVKDFAGKTLPTLQHHYEMVQQLSSDAGDAAASNDANGAATPMAPAPDAAAPSNDNMAQAPAAAPSDNMMAPANPPAGDAAQPPADQPPAASAPADNAAPAAGEPANADVDMSTLSPVDLATLKGDDLKGMDVVNSAGEKIASVNDFVLNDDGKIDAIIVDFGGFLGIGTKQVAVAFEGANVMADDNNNRYLVVNTSKEQLEAQPAYNKDDYAANRDTQLLKTSE